MNEMMSLIFMCFDITFFLNFDKFIELNSITLMEEECVNPS